MPKYSKPIIFFVCILLPSGLLAQEGKVIATVLLPAKDILLSVADHPTDSIFSLAVANTLNNLDKNNKDVPSIFQNAFEAVAGDRSLSGFASDYCKKHLLTNDEQIYRQIGEYADSLTEACIEVLKLRVASAEIYNASVNRASDCWAINLTFSQLQMPKEVEILFSHGICEMKETANADIFWKWAAAVDSLLKFSPLLYRDYCIASQLVAGADTSDRIFKDKAFSTILNMNEIPDGQPVVGIVESHDTARINFILRIPDIRKMTENVHFCWSLFPDPNNRYSLIILENKNNQKVIAGKDIKDAKCSVSPEGINCLEITLNKKGASLLEKFTRDNIGESLAILIDDNVFAWPVIKTAISGGKIMITGVFEILRVKMIAAIINCGPMPVGLKISNIYNSTRKRD